MTRTTLNKVLDQVRALSRAEQEQLREALDGLLAAPPAPPTEDEFEQEMLRLGMLSDLHPPVAPGTPYPDWEPIKIKGKPLSETIIEERG